VRIKKIFYHPKFKKAYQKLPLEIKKKAEKKEKIFRQNCFDPRLKTHKLTGKLKDISAFWIDKHYRILFIFYEKDSVIFLDVGTHEIYK